MIKSLRNEDGVDEALSGEATSTLPFSQDLMVIARV